MHPAPAGRGAAIEVRFSNGLWYRGHLVKRIPGANPPRWRVRFDDGEVRDDIRLDSESTPVRFDAASSHGRVEVHYDGSWYRGRLVELIKGSVVWGVAFDDGDWAEDVRLGDPDVRVIDARDAGVVLAGQKRKRDDGMVSDVVNAGNRKCTCSTCGKAFSRSRDLARHMRMHTGEPAPYKCSLCSQAFSKPAYLEKHLCGEPPFECLTCGRVFKRSGNLRVHTRVCTSRGKPSPKARDAAAHHRTHSNDRPRGNLKKHMRIHSNDRPHKCSTCGMAFAQIGTLQQHMRVHTGEQPYKCSTCGKAFSQSGNMMGHMRRVHSGKRPRKA
jgi:DNA-directed RNA polymerase subunit RPC12/RpoP